MCMHAHVHAHDPSAKSEQHRLALQLKSRHEELQASITQHTRQRDVLQMNVNKSVMAMNKANQRE